jgi:oxalate---CoA ligase
MLTSSAPIASETLADVIRQHARREPEREAIVAFDFAPVSFGQLDLQIRHLGEQLREGGIGASSRVGVLLAKDGASAIVGLSIACNATCVPLNPELTASELQEEATSLRLNALVIPSWLDSAKWSAVRSVGVFRALTTAPTPFGVTLKQVGRVPSSSRPSDDDVSPQSSALLLRSSGTTGIPKLIPVTHRNLLEMASKMRAWFGLSLEDRCACMLPLCYAQGFKSALVVPLLLGGSVALPSARNSEDLTGWMSDLQPTWFSAGPTLLQAVLRKLRAARGGIEHSLRFILSSSAYLPEAVRAELETILGVPVLEFYGLSEAGLMAANPAPPAKRKPGTAGLIAANELAIKDQSGNLLPSGAIGEIVVHGPSVTPGYVNDEDASATGFQNGWLHTGDLGCVDSEGFLTLVGRTKEMINRGGEKISPYEIEKALLLHPSVQEAAAFAVPHPRLGENVATAVVLKPATNVASADLKEFLRPRLAHFKIPQNIFITPALPRGPTGKILRSELAADVANRVVDAAPAIGSLEAQIKEIWQKLIGRDDVGVEDDFFELGGDSLLATEMLLEIELLAQRHITAHVLGPTITVRTLASALTKATPIEKKLVTRAKPGSATPFFFCHGDYSFGGRYAIKLAQLMGDDQPFYLLHPWTDLKKMRASSIEAMAESYISHLLTIQPGGAFRLGGYCNGGLVAWEIARQLTQAGREVEFVVLIDTLSLNARRSLRAIGRILKRIYRSQPPTYAFALMPVLWRLARRIGTRDANLVGRATSNIYKLVIHGPWQNTCDQLGTIYHQKMANYVPPRIDTDVFCLVCEEYSGLKEYSPLAWRHAARCVHYECVPGGHDSCITEHVADLAAKFRLLLQRGGRDPDAPLHEVSAWEGSSAMGGP